MSKLQAGGPALCLWYSLGSALISALPSSSGSRGTTSNDGQHAFLVTSSKKERRKKTIQPWNRNPFSVPLSQLRSSSQIWRWCAAWWLTSAAFPDQTLRRRLESPWVIQDSTLELKEELVSLGSCGLQRKEEGVQSDLPFIINGLTILIDSRCGRGSTPFICWVTAFTIKVVSKSTPPTQGTLCYHSKRWHFKIYCTYTGALWEQAPDSPNISSYEQPLTHSAVLAVNPAHPAKTLGSLALPSRRKSFRSCSTHARYCRMDAKVSARKLCTSFPERRVKHCSSHQPRSKKFFGLFGHPLRNIWDLIASYSCH